MKIICVVHLSMFRITFETFEMYRDSCYNQ